MIAGGEHTGQLGGEGIRVEERPHLPSINKKDRVLMFAAIYMQIIIKPCKDAVLVAGGRGNALQRASEGDLARLGISGLPSDRTSPGCGHAHFGCLGATRYSSTPPQSPCHRNSKTTLINKFMTSQRGACRGTPFRSPRRVVVARRAGEAGTRVSNHPGPTHAPQLQYS